VNETGSKRPDAIVAEIVQQKLRCTIGFSEVKTDDSKKKTESLLYQDMIRLGMISKDTIDLYDLSNCVTFQAVVKFIFILIFLLMTCI
jgi:hypothetical protein